MEQRNSSSFWFPVAAAYRRRDWTMYLNKYSDPCGPNTSNGYFNNNDIEDVLHSLDDVIFQIYTYR